MQSIAKNRIRIQRKDPVNLYEQGLEDGRNEVMAGSTVTVTVPIIPTRPQPSTIQTYYGLAAEDIVSYTNDFEVDTEPMTRSISIVCTIIRQEPSEHSRTCMHVSRTMRAYLMEDEDEYVHFLTSLVQDASMYTDTLKFTYDLVTFISRNRVISYNQHTPSDILFSKIKEQLGYKDE